MQLEARAVRRYYFGSKACSVECNFHPVKFINTFSDGHREEYNKVTPSNSLLCNTRLVLLR